MVDNPPVVNHVNKIPPKGRPLDSWLEERQKERERKRVGKIERTKESE